MNRAINSAKRYTKSSVLNGNKGDSVISISWKAAKSDRYAFIEEFALQTRLKVKNKDTYNKIWSPGRRFFGK